MSERLRFLIIDCYDADGQLSLQKSGATLGGQLYLKLLNILAPDAQKDIYNIALLDQVEIDPSIYDGACWTGSNLFLSADNPACINHINLCHAFFERGTPQFGSCWAAQLASVTAGGTVAANPLGREFGYIRDIKKTEAGKSHPMLQGKPDTYACFASHRDSITELSAQAEILSGNAHSAVQALDVLFLNGHFWATQYHSEYDYAEVGNLAQTRKQALINDAVFETEADVDLFSEDLLEYQNSQGQSLEIRYGFDPAMRYPAVNAFELRNWLAHFFNL